MSGFHRGGPLALDNRQQKNGSPEPIQPPIKTNLDIQQPVSNQN